MKNSNPKPGRSRRVALVIALIVSIILSVAFFFFGLIRQIEAESAANQAAHLQGEVIELQAELESCVEQAAIARSQAAAAMAEAEKQLQLRKQNR